MVLRVRIRSAKLFKQYTSYSKMSSYVILIGGGQKLRTDSSNQSHQNPIWQESLLFTTNPPNLKVEIWVEHPNGDILAGEILMDLCNFYQREPFRIEPKKITLVDRNVGTAEMKVELDFDFDGMSNEQMQRIKKEGMKPEKEDKGGLQVGTVIAIGRKAHMKRQEAEKREVERREQMPYQKPPSANNNKNQYGGNGNKNGNQRNDKDFYNKPNPWNNNTNGNTGNNGNNGNMNKNDWSNGWGDNINANNNPKKEQNWGNLDNNNANNNGWDNPLPPIKPTNNNNNIFKAPDLMNLFGNIINTNENNNAKKQPVKIVPPPSNDWNTGNNKNTGWDNWKPPSVDTNNRKKDDPWNNNQDPYGNNNGWDL